MNKVKLGDVVYRSKEFENKDETDLEFYIGGEHFDNATLTITKKGIIRGSTIGPAFNTKFKPGDVLLMSRNPHLRKASVVDFEGICSDVSYVIRSKDETVILQKFIPLLFQSDIFWEFAERNKKGSTNFFLNWSDFAKFEFILPSIVEQQKICDELWSIYHTIKSYRDMIDANNKLLKSYFVEMFRDSSSVVDFKDYVWFQEGPGVRSVDFRDRGTILLTGSNINNNKISFGYSSDRFISEELSSGKYTHFMCKKDDILAVTSAIAPNKFDEKIVVVDEDDLYCLNTGIIRFRPNLSYMTRAYFKEFMKSDYFKDQVSENMRGVCQMHFGPSHLKKMKLLLPASIEIQLEFDQFVAMIENSNQELKKGIETLKKLYRNISNNYMKKED